jgi:hypothetical protein
MSNAAAQLVVCPLFRRGIFSFSAGIGEDVLGNLFSSKDLLREQVKDENEEGWIIRLQSRAKERMTENLLSNGALLLWSVAFLDGTENLLSNGVLLWWSVAFLDGLLSLVRHGLGVFPLEQREKM